MGTPGPVESQARRLGFHYKDRMNAPRIDCETLQAFLDEVSRAGVQKVALRAVKEIRPRHLPNHGVEVGPQRWVELAAYAKGTLIAARLDGVEGEVVRGALEQRGLEVRAGSGNIT